MCLFCQIKFKKRKKEEKDCPVISWDCFIRAAVNLPSQSLKKGWNKEERDQPCRFSVRSCGKIIHNEQEIVTQSETRIYFNEIKHISVLSHAIFKQQLPSRQSYCQISWCVKLVTFRFHFQKGFIEQLHSFFFLHLRFCGNSDIEKHAWTQRFFLCLYCRQFPLSLLSLQTEIDRSRDKREQGRFSRRCHGPRGFTAGVSTCVWSRSVGMYCGF